MTFTSFNLHNWKSVSKRRTESEKKNIQNRKSLCSDSYHSNRCEPFKETTLSLNTEYYNIKIVKRKFENDEILRKRYFCDRRFSTEMKLKLLVHHPLTLNSIRPCICMVAMSYARAMQIQDARSVALISTRWTWKELQNVIWNVPAGKWTGWIWCVMKGFRM